MHLFRTESFNSAFETAGIREGDVLNIHSSLLSFGMPSDCEVSRLPERVTGILFDLLGQEGTIAVPAFNFDFCKGVPFDRQFTPSKLMGVFSEYIRTRKESIRSSHPMQSVAAIGKDAAVITKNDTLSAFQDGGAWQTMERLNAKVLLLGSDFKSPSFFHLIEEREKVPYRYWKSFTGKYTDQGIESERTYRMYVRDMELSPVLNISSIEQMLISRDQISQVTIGSGTITCFLASDFIACATEKIRANPYYFVSNHKDYLKE